MTAQPTEHLLLDPHPALRLLPAPSSAPPYDDELPDAPALRVVGMAPRRVLPTAGPTPGAAAAPSVPAHSPRLSEAQELDAWLAAERTPTSALPASRGHARALVQVLLEVLAGVRPVSQLRRETSSELYAVLEATVAGHPRTSGPRPDGRAVRSIHVQERPEGVVEVCATVLRAGRAGALALRLEGLDGRWRCTQLAGL